MNKKGDISITIIIYAAIALIVMVVLWAIFTGRMGHFVESLKGEEAKATDKSGDILKSCQLEINPGSCGSPNAATGCPEGCSASGTDCVYQSSFCVGRTEDKCGGLAQCTWA